MFDIGFSEIVVIAVVALIVIGPERLPKAARTLGHLFGRLQRYVNDVKADINREMELDELRKLQKEVQTAAMDLKSSVESAARGVESGARVLRREALVGVIVALEDEVRVVVVQDLPEDAHVRGRPAARAVQGDVPVGERARVRVGLQVGLQPVVLGRARSAAAGAAAVRVERHDVPGADVEAVVALGRVARGSAAWRAVGASAFGAAAFGATVD